MFKYKISFIDIIKKIKCLILILKLEQHFSPKHLTLGPKGNPVGQGGWSVLFCPQPSGLRGLDNCVVRQNCTLSQ